MVSAQSLDHKNLGDLNAMIKALERLKESRPNVSFVKTGVSSAEIPRFLVNKEIVQESKRTYVPTPMAMDVANMDRGLESLAPLKKTKRSLKKSKRLNLIKERSIQKQVESQPQLAAPVKANKKTKQTQRQYKRGFWHWLEELAIIMSKMSLFGLFLILMLLGTVFFGVGFLAAVSNVQEKSGAQPTWQQASACHNASGGDKPNPFLKAASGVASTLVDQKVASIESKLGGGFLNKAVEKVPPSLQPFALQMQNKFAQSSQAVISSGGRAVKGAFKPSRFGDTPPPPPPPQVATSTPPSYHPIFGAQQSQPVAVEQPPSLHQLNPTQKSFQQAGQHYDKAMAAPQYAPAQPQAYAQPQQPAAYGYQPQQYGQVVQPQPQAYAPPQQPVYAAQAYQQQPVVSQPYGASQPYGYTQAPAQEQPKFIGMG